MAWSDGLSSEQRQAASHWGSSARILAGPGTGKTRSLIQRVAYLLQERRVQPDQIVAITFTRAAARELEQRLTEHLGVSQTELPLVCTLHSYALRILLKHQAQSGIIQPLRVADDYEEENVLFPEIGRMIGKPAGEVEKAFRAFEATWNTLDQQHEAWQAIKFRHEFEIALHDLSEFYGFTLRGELVYRLLRLLDANPLIGSSLGVEHLLVDEYQDLNFCDQQTISRLEQWGANLFVVGDDDQSIYDFRHAYPEGIRTFLDQRVDGGDYQLRVCHRCPIAIVDLARNLIEWDRMRVPRHLLVESTAVRGEVHALQFRGYAEEADGIAAICRAYVDAGILQPQDISILLSRRGLAKPIVEALDAVDLPSTVLVPIWPLDEEPGRLIYCVLRLLADRYDALALRTWIGLQKGVGPGTLERVREFSRRQSLTLWDGLSTISTNPSQIARGQALKAYFDDLNKLLEELQPIDSVEHVLDRLVGHGDDNLSEEKGQLRAFLDRILEDEQIENVVDLVHTLETFDIEAETQLGANAVRVMTMHKAKGLSSELVFIPALEQALIPGQYEEDISRRLLYVSMTRAQRILIMTHALSRTGAQSYLGTADGQWQRQRSRLLDEMGIRSQVGATFISDLAKDVRSAVEKQEEGVNTAVLRELIRVAFSDEELSFFCYDHYRDVYDEFSVGMSKSAKIQRLIEYAVRRVQVLVLIEQVKDTNQAQFARFEQQLFA